MVGARYAVMTAGSPPGICTKKVRKHPFSLLLVVQPTITNGSSSPPGPIPPKNTPQDGLTTRIARLTGVGKGGCMMARVASARAALDPAQALQREKLSGGSDPHRICP